MKKLLLLFALLICASGLKAEIWTPVGQVTWYEGILSWQNSRWNNKSWQVIVEQSDERPKVFRMQPYSNHPLTYTNTLKDNTYVYIHTENPNMVYIENFNYCYHYYGSGAYDYYRVFQRCPENGFDSAYYGKVSDNNITFPIGAFAVDECCTKSRPDIDMSSPSSYVEYSTVLHKIVFEDGVLDNIPAKETFVSIGEGIWQHNGMFGVSEDHRLWHVEFEKSLDTPNRYRVRPYASYEAMRALGFKDDVAVVICADDPQKIYIESYIFSDNDVSQDVPENGWPSGTSYGTMTDGVITIPARSFKVKPTDTETWNSNKYSDNPLVITLPSDYFKTPSSSGVYFGITAFNYSPEIKTIELLSKNNKSDFKSYVNKQEMADATYLYYSVDVAINALAERKYPDDLNSVALITFTDGNDDGSLDKADPTWNDADYQNYLSNRIANVKVQGLPIDAYSVGLKGGDIGDYNYDIFKKNLKVLASNDEKASEASDMTQVETTFNNIIDNLEKSWINEKASCSINMRATGDVIRFTLDKSREEMNNNPEQSEKWIQGVFSRADNSLNDIEYHGVTSTSGIKVLSSEIEVEINGRLVKKYKFTFENLRDLDNNPYKATNIEYWHHTESSTIWQPHTEIRQGIDSGTETARTSSAIMFVMDCSTSLGDDFPELKRVVNSLIDRLAPDESTGIDSPVVDLDDDENAPVEYYNLQGIRVENPSAGLYIMRQGKKASKVLIR